MAVKSAIVGCGAISKVHAGGIAEAGASLIAVCDLLRERGEKICDRVYTDLDSMLNSEQIDVLHICLPHCLHVPVAIKALERGINVMLEKPPAMDISEYGLLKTALERSNASLCVCFQNRYNETTQKAVEIIKSGEYGKLLGARGIVTWQREGAYYSESKWRGKKKFEGGGVLINQAIHTLDLLNFLLGSPKCVKSAVNNFTHPDTDVEDNVSAVIDYPDSRALFFATTSFTSSPPAEITLSFEKANVTFDSKSLRVSSEKTQEYSVGTVPGKAVWGNSHKIIISKFYDSLSGRADNPCTLESCYDTMKTLNEIYKE